MNIFGLGPGELILVLTLALIVFGPKKLPEIGAGLGKAVGQFRKATNDLTQEINREMQSDGLKELASLKDVPRDLRGVANSFYEAATRPEPKAAEAAQTPPVAQPAEQPQTAGAANEASPVTNEAPPVPMEATPAAVKPAPVMSVEHDSQPSGAPRRLRIRESGDQPPTGAEAEPGH
jgi:TatA/E family protein of Tat protein translocase